ncbi:MAG: hypothetical protein KA319_11855 [Ferruginibacter sp.]|nr:hypothetical protein [Ferruginibacter sp.]
MKKFTTIRLITFTSLSAILITLSISYLTAVLLGIGDIKLSSLLLLFFIQSLVWYFSSILLLKIFSRQLTVTKTINKYLFGVIFICINFFLLLFFDFVFSTITDFNFSVKFGAFLDLVLADKKADVSSAESFQIAPISLQNLAFNLIAIVFQIFGSAKIYCFNYIKKKNLFS